MALDTCPERSFMIQLYFGIQKEYQKQPPKMGALYLDRMQPTSDLFLPAMRSYGTSIQKEDYTSLATGSNTYSGNSVGRSYDRSSHLGYSPANSAYQS